MQLLDSILAILAPSKTHVSYRNYSSHKRSAEHFSCSQRRRHKENSAKTKSLILSLPPACSSSSSSKLSGRGKPMNCKDFSSFFSCSQTFVFHSHFLQLYQGTILSPPKKKVNLGFGGHFSNRLNLFH